MAIKAKGRPTPHKADLGYALRKIRVVQCQRIFWSDGVFPGGLCPRWAPLKSFEGKRRRILIALKKVVFAKGIEENRVRGIG